MTLHPQSSEDRLLDTIDVLTEEVREMRLRLEGLHGRVRILEGRLLARPATPFGRGYLASEDTRGA